MKSFFDDAADWSRGRSWLLRFPLVLYLLYAGYHYISDPVYVDFLFSGIILGVHELGHFVFRFGEFLTVLGGSIAQIGAPIAAAIILYRQRDYFGFAVGTIWLAFSLFAMATYMADARARDLPLVAPGVGAVLPGDESVGHDWNYIFNALGVLPYDTLIADATRLLAFMVFIASTIFIAWLLFRMAGSPAGSPKFGK